MNSTERFLKLVSIGSTSEETSSSCPSTPEQLEVGKEAVRQLISIGVKDAHLDEHGYVYGTIPSNTEDEVPVVGLISHMDTSPDACGENIRPRITEPYGGGDIVLNEEKGIVLSPAEYPSLLCHKGKRLIVTDGTTLLGGDDKAGVAEIISAAEKILNSGRKHGTVKIGFTPDEEIGRGADLFDIAGFGADYAYTVDGGRIGEIEYENFNAASAAVKINGCSIHPGDAKGKMKNAALIAMEFNTLLPGRETPFYTEGYEGFFHLTGMSGEVESAELDYIIRDHDREKFEKRKKIFADAVAEMNSRYGAGTVQAEIKDTYYNMKEKIEPCMFLIENAKAAFARFGVEAGAVPIRGGTDGARLSYEGLPCPNLCTGGENFHSRFEYVPVEDMETISDVLAELIFVFAE